MKLTLISKFVAAQTGKQIITIHVLANISRNKGNQVMKSGQLKEYNARHIFQQKSCRKWDWETKYKPLFVLKKPYMG